MKGMKMKKLLIVLSAVFLLTGMLSCTPKKAKPLEISEEEALEVLKELVPKSYEINEIFFGKGLPNDGSETVDGTKYVAVDHEKSKYLSVEAIKAAAEAVYSSRYLSSVYVPMFEGSASSSEDGLLDNDLSPRYKLIAGVLHIDTSYAAFNIANMMHIDSVKIIKKTAEYVELEGTGTDSMEQTFVRRFFITLENSGVWRLDSPTY